MRFNLQHKSARTIRAIATVICLPAILFNTGCVTAPTMRVEAQRYRIEVALNPATHHLTGLTAIDLVRSKTQTQLHNTPPNMPVDIELHLHPDLKITRVYASGAKVTGRSSDRKYFAKQESMKSTRHRIHLNRAVDALTLLVEYSGTIYQDVSAGEISGEIHNHKMRAHIAAEGIYLAGSNWYPEPATDDDNPTLADYTLLTRPIDGFELVASGHHDNKLGAQTGGLAWRSAYPLDGMVLVGGPHEVHHINHYDIAIRAHLKPDQSEYADGLLATAKRILDRYEPLIGKYPAKEFSIVDNFFSSGFAFPMFTLLSSAVIEMGERSQTAHGYIDHEMLHSWWGNGIHVDPRDGNWCEALTSYATNYYGYILDGNMDEARRKRRNYSHFLSRMKPEKDRPLGTYGLPDGCSRGVSYSKGAAVFHMLAMKIGQNHFWSAMRKFTRDYVGRYASWDDIQKICENQSGIALDTFFDQWVRRSGAPALSIESARFQTSDQLLTLNIHQGEPSRLGEPSFELDVPIRIMHVGGETNIVVKISSPQEEVMVHVNVTPLSVELDPGYHVFRKIPLDDIIPTTARTRYGTALTTVLPTGEVAKPYSTIQSIFESSFEDQEHIAMTADQLREGSLADRCVLVLGDTVRHPYVSGFLSAVEFPVRWSESGFTLSGVEYNHPKDAVLCTVRHPGVEGGGITVVYANSDQAIPKPMNIPMYDRSLIVFEDGKPTVRLDFEQRNIVHVERQ